MDKAPGAHYEARAFLSPQRAFERSEEHTSELQSPCNLVCRLLLEKKKNEPVRELIIQLFSVRLKDADSEPDRILSSPLSCEPITENESDRDLNSELFSPRIDDVLQ